MAYDEEGMDMTLSEKIKKKAREIGFEKTGICAAEPLEQEKQRLQEWLARGYHGTMAYMARNFEKRMDVKKVYPDAKSIVVCALNYFRDEKKLWQAHGGAKISMYAQGKDYHDVVKEKLSQLLSYIQSGEPKANGKIYVDTGSLLEKALAVRAGLGWQGKNTNILTEDAGSFFFIGVLLLNLPLPPDAAPAFDGCRDCTLCLDACPTRAFPEPYVLDAAKCISYLTIEYKGEIDAALAEKMDGWLFGCDVCQQVCPYNVRDAEPANVEEFYAKTELREKTLLDFLLLSENDFKELFRGTPVLRAKWKGFMRNCDIAAEAMRKEAAWTR